MYVFCVHPQVHLYQPLLNKLGTIYNSNCNNSLANHRSGHKCLRLSTNHSQCYNPSLVQSDHLLPLVVEWDNSSLFHHYNTYNNNNKLDNNNKHRIYNINKLFSNHKYNSCNNHSNKYNHNNNQWHQINNNNNQRKDYHSQ